MTARHGPGQNPADHVKRETAASPPALSPAFVGPGKQLGAFLRVAETGYTICVCNAPADRRRILDSLLPELADDDIGVFELELDKSAASIPGRVRVALTTDAFKALAARFATVAVSITGAEATITAAERTSAGRPKVIQGLNQQRDWMDQLGHPILFWVSEWLLGLLPRIAPDFWAGRSVVVQFPPADEVRAQAYTEVSSGPGTFNSLEEAKRRIRIYQDLLRGETDPKTKAGFLHNLAVLHHALGDLDAARKLYNQSLAIAQELGSKTGIAQVLHNLAAITQGQGDYTEARKLYNQSLAVNRELGNETGIAQDLHQLAMLAHDQGDYAEARKLYDQSFAIVQELGDKTGIAGTLHQLAMLAHDQGTYAEARKLYHQSLAITQELGNKAGIAQTLHQLAVLAHDQGDYAEARKLYDQSLVTKQELGDKAGIAQNLHQLAMLAQHQGDYAKARKLYHQSLAIVQKLDDKAGIAETTAQLGRLAEVEKDDRTALGNYTQALSIFEELKSPYRDLAKKDIARMRERLGDEAFKKLCDEVVAEMEGLTANG